MTEQEVERLTGLLHDAYPCSQQGCRETGEQFAALVAEVRRLRELVEAAFHEGWHAGWSHEKPEVKLGVHSAAGYDWVSAEAHRRLEEDE